MQIKAAFLTEADAPHTDIYLDCLSRSRGIAQVSISDPSGKVQARAGPVAKGYADYHELLRQEKPDLAVISFVPDHAPEAIEAALKADCHVLAEKPACVRPQDFEQLVMLAQSRRRLLMLAFANRVHPLVTKARELVQSGQLGKLYGAQLYFLADQTRLRSREYQRSWFASRKRGGGGQLLWLGIHYVDLIQFISSLPIVQVRAFIQNIGRQPMDVEDSAAIAMEFEGGMLGTLQSGYYLGQGYQGEILIWGSEGWLRADLESGPLTWSLNANNKIFSMPAPSQSISLYPPFIQSVIDAVAGVGKPPVTARECLRDLQVVFGAYQSSATGRVQRIP
jgi:predicted dehydrogenase